MTPALLSQLASPLPPREYILIGSCAFFFGLIALMWFVGKCMPAWDERQRARQRPLQGQRVDRSE